MGRQLSGREGGGALCTTQGGIGPRPYTAWKGNLVISQEKGQSPERYPSIGALHSRQPIFPAQYHDGVSKTNSHTYNSG